MEGTRSIVDADIGLYDGLNFAVHNYTHIPSTSPIVSTNGELLSLGYGLIKSGASRSDGWLNTKSLVLSKLGITDLNSYRYRHPPPIIELPSAEESCEDGVNLREWGSVVQDDEIWRLDALDEFVSTNLSGVVNPKPRDVQEPMAGNHGQTRKRSLAALEDTCPSHDHSSSISVASFGSGPKDEDGGKVPDGEPSPKRRKMYYGALHNVVPQPHAHPSPIRESTSTNPPLKLREYKKTIPIIIPPYTNPLPPPSKYDRRAWLVPIRGTMPWEGSTSANVLDPSERIPIGPAPRSLEPINWSRDAVQAFWSFLLTLQKTGRIGTLGLSFQASSEYKESPTPHSFMDHGDSSLGIGAQRVTGGMMSSGSDTPAVLALPSGGGNLVSQFSVRAENGSSLASVDYVKVYHEAVMSMLVRTALDVWAYEVKDGGGKVVEKVRVLKGAKLVLVDHLSKGMLIS